MFHDIENFLKGPAINKWCDIDAGYSTVYLRKAQRLIDGKMVSSIDVATINLDPDYQGRGILTALLGFLEEYEYDIIYVESILHSWLAEYLEQRLGYTVIHVCDISRNAYKWIRHDS